MIMENHHSLIKSIVQHRMEYVLRRFVIPIISVDIPKCEVISFVGYQSIYGVIMRPVRRTHTSRRRSPGGDYSAVVTYQGQPGLTIRQGRQILMCVGVVLHRVTLVDLAPHEMGTRGHVLTYIEEGGPRLVVLENVEDLRSLVLYGTVVERQVNRGHLLLPFLCPDNGLKPTNALAGLWAASICPDRLEDRRSSKPMGVYLPRVDKSRHRLASFLLANLWRVAST